MHMFSWHLLNVHRMDNPIAGSAWNALFKPPASLRLTRRDKAVISVKHNCSYHLLSIYSLDTI